MPCDRQLISFTKCIFGKPRYRLPRLLIGALVLWRSTHKNSLTVYSIKHSPSLHSPTPMEDAPPMGPERGISAALGQKTCKSSLADLEKKMSRMKKSNQCRVAYIKPRPFLG